MKRYALLLICFSLFLAVVFGTPVFADDSITVRVGVYENNPKIFTDESGDAAGFWPEIIEYIASEEEWEIEYVQGTWTQCLNRLAQNEIDIMPDVAYTEERAALYDFSNETVYVSWSRVYTRGVVDIESILDLEGKNIAVLQGSINVEGPDGIKILVSEFDINCTFIEVDSYTRVFELVESGEADAGVTSKDFGYKHKAEFNVVETAIIFQPSSLYFAFPQDSSLTPYLIERIDSRVAELKADKDSIYYQALATWFGIEPAEKPLIPAWLKWALIGVGGLALLLGGGSLVLRSRIKSRTKALREEISHRKKTEEALQQSNQRFNDIAENALEWIWEVDAEGKYTYASPVVEQILGYKPEEVIGKHFYDLFHPDDREELKKAAFAVFAEKQPFRQFVNRNIRKDGEIAWLVTSGVPVLDGEGNLLGYRGADIDITESKQTEETLRENEAFQSGLLSNSPVPINVVNPDGSLRYVSPALEKLTGFSAEELLWRKPPYPYWPKERQEEIIKHFKKAMRQGSKGVVELYQKKNGEKFWVEITSTPVKKDGKFQYLLGSWVDITERKQAEEALQESEARYRAVIEGAHDMIQSVGLDGSIIFVNKSWLDTLGYTEADLASLNLFDIIHPDSQERCRKIMAEVVKGKPARNIGTAFLTKDGRKILVEGNAAPRYIGNRVVATQGIFRDVTERKRVEAALADEATRRRILIDESSDGIVILDENGKVYEANRRFAEMLGYTPEEVRKLSVWDWEFQYPREQVAEMIRTVDETGDHFETKHRRKDGTVFDVEISTNGAVYAGQKLIFCVCRDITARKQAEEKLRDEATRRRILIDESSDGISTLDEKGKIIEVNRRFAEMLGYTPEEVLKLHVWDFEALLPREQVLKRIKNMGPEGDHFETKHRRKDGTVFDVEISSNSAIYAGQKLIFSVARDITARKQAEAALRESEEKYKNLVGATSDIIWEADAQGWFTFISPKIKDVLGYRVDEVVGKKRTLDLIPKGESPKWLKRFKEISAKKAPFFGFEIPHVHKNGSLVICETSGIPLFDGAGNFKGYVGIDRDITERRRMQEQLVITDRLASVGELAAGIAHELNNPLTGVIGFSQLLMDKKVPEDIKQDIKVVYSEAQRASQVVKNLLTFARRHAAVKEKVNINDIIRKVLELRAYEQNLENIKVDARLDPKLPEVMVDYFQLQQVFLNIIINAEYFMKEARHGGKLTITTEKVGNKVRASFADDGPGIAKENLGHLFDPFFTTKEVGRGTGLGLSICHGVVAEHGGRIYVESELGKGATFIVELPIGAAERKGGTA